MGLLIFSLIMVIMFEATNGFHDAANAVATVIYTKSLQPGPAAVRSGVMNFVGVLVGGIAVEDANFGLIHTYWRSLTSSHIMTKDDNPLIASRIVVYGKAELTTNAFSLHLWRCRQDVNCGSRPISTPRAPPRWQACH
jgi:phosphate/sulfate permease